MLGYQPELGKLSISGLRILLSIMIRQAEYFERVEPDAEKSKFARAEIVRIKERIKSLGT